MQKLPRGTLAGERVVVRGEPWLVVQGEAFDDCVLVTLRGTGDHNRGRIARLLTPFDRLAPVRISGRVRLAARPTVIAAAAQSVARAHTWLESWRAAAANIDLLPWQIEPAMAAVAGATRLLLTDDVGLGKTIQAGLILAELRARGFVSRALILTPASLREQWASELRDRFQLDAQVFGQPDVVRLTAQLPVGVNPWSTADLLISSIDLVKRAEIRAAIDAVPFDLLVVDEAHHLTPGTDRGALVADLAGRIPWIVLATATPHSGDEEAFAFLHRMGEQPDGPAPIVFRRSAQDVGRARSRHMHFHRVQPTPEERAMLDETLAYATALWRHRDRQTPTRAFVGSVICRRAVSSSRALALTLARRRQLLAEQPPQMLPHPPLPWLEEEAADGVVADALLGADRLPDAQSERARLERLIALAERVRMSSKFDAIERVLSRMTEPAIIFSEYRDTLVAIEDRLAPTTTIATLHGGLSARDRREAVLRFLDGDARVLLATDAAGEGLNLQARCRLVVNVELPWNPVRLEQRAGRVDRLGQERRVHAVHLYHRDSFEDRVLARLQRRIASAARDLAGSSFDEAAVAAAVFDGRPIEMHVVEPSPDRASMQTAAHETARLRRRAQRCLQVRPPHGDAGALCARLPARAARVSRMVMVFEWDVHDADQRLTTREVACVIAEFDRARLVRGKDIVRLARAIADCRFVDAHVSGLRAERLLAAASATRLTALALERRLASIDRALRLTGRAPFQGSLFDRRAEQRAQASRLARDTARSRIARLLASARALRSLTTDEPVRLIAAWTIGAE
jgi:superfamily II DNA or RNA helicase